MATSSSIVPAALFLSFFEEAAQALNELQYDKNEEPKSVDEYRQSLLNIQQQALEKIVSNFDGVSLEQVLGELNQMESTPNDSSLKEPLESMTVAARTALARVVLQQALQQHKNTARAGALTKSSVLEFCGLCQAAVLLEDVTEFLVSSDQPLELYQHAIVDKKLPFPHERLEYIQHRYFEALGYDADVAANELKDMVTASDESQEFLQVFQQTVAQLRVVITNATLAVQTKQLSDFQQGGVTRVVSVEYSESTTQSAPTQQTMQSEQQDQLHMARSAAALEQALLGQLLQMDESERNEVLERARVAQDELQRMIAELPPGPERVAYMTSISRETQQSLVMYKLWQGLLQRNNGQPPKMHHASE